MPFLCLRNNYVIIAKVLMRFSFEQVNLLLDENNTHIEPSQNKKKFSNPPTRIIIQFLKSNGTGQMSKQCLKYSQLEGEGVGANIRGKCNYHIIKS